MEKWPKSLKAMLEIYALFNPFGRTNTQGQGAAFVKISANG